MQIHLKAGQGNNPDEIVFHGGDPLYISGGNRATTEPKTGTIVFDHTELSIGRDGKTTDSPGLKPGTIVAAEVLEAIRNSTQMARHQ